MAPVNIGYSNKVYCLKTTLIQFINENDKNGCTFEVFKLRLKKLWAAVLGENFVFNFKNTLAVSAYNKIDSQYSQWSWTLQYIMLQWQKRTKTAFDSHTCAKDIENLHNKCIADAHSKLDMTYKDLCDKMKTFITESDHVDTLSEHEFEIQNRLKLLKDEHKLKASEYCKNLVKSKLNYLKGETKRESCFLKLQNDITKYVLQLRANPTELDDKDSGSDNKCISLDDKLTKAFEKKWTDDWVECNKINHPGDDEIDKEISDVLKDKLVSQQTIITKKLSASSLQQRKFPSSSTTYLQLNPELHIASNRFIVMKWILGKNNVTKAEEDCNTIIKEVHISLQKKIEGDLPLLKPLVTQALNELLESIDKKNHSDNVYIFTKNFKVDSAILICAYIFCTYKEKTKQLKDNDPIYYLEGFKTTFLNNFISQYKHESKEESAAGGLCNLLKSPIINELKGHLETEIVDKIISTHEYTHNKKKFKEKILTDLVHKNDFRLYITYLEDIELSLKQWAKFYINQFCQEKINAKKRITTFSEARLSFVIETITKATETLRNQTSSINDWIEKFHMKLSTVLSLDKSAMLKIVGAQKIDSLQSFETFAIDGFGKLKEKIQQEISSSSSTFADVTSWQNSPHLQLCKNLIGCNKMCPFCKEQCELGSNHPGQHTVSLHRPECLGKYVYVKDQQLVLKLCTEAVSSNITFINADTSGRHVPFKMYGDYYPEWDIPENTIGDPIYWKWFIFKYQVDIQKWIGSSDTSIPPSWNISEKAVIENLKDMFKTK